MAEPAVGALVARVTSARTRAWRHLASPSRHQVVPLLAHFLFLAPKSFSPQPKLAPTKTQALRRSRVPLNPPGGTEPGAKRKPRSPRRRQFLKPVL